MKTYTLDVICCYCGIKQGEKVGFSHYDPIGTSTICPRCLKMEMECTVMDNGKQVYTEGNRAWNRWPSGKWEEIDIEIIKRTLPKLA